MEESTYVQQMRHTGPAVRATGLAAIVIALLAIAPGLSSASRTKPHLKLLDRAPLTMKGASFHVRERVRVTVATTATTTRTVRASRGGTFTVRFDSVSVARCGDLAVQAVGARGDRASLKVLQPEDCAPGLGP